VPREGRQRAACRHPCTRDHIVEANTLLSGIGFESGGLATRPCRAQWPDAGAGHARVLPWEKVAFGALTGLHLAEASADEMATVYAFCEEWACRRRSQRFGVRNADMEIS